MDQFYYSAEDFFADESFQRFVLQTSPKDAAYWEHWIAQHPEKAEEVAQAILLVEALYRPEQELSPEEIAVEQGRFDAFLATHPARQRWLRTSTWLYACAASVLLLLVGYWVWTTQRIETPMSEYTTGANEKLRLTLPDRSVVYLNANTTLRVAKTWTARTERQVWLKGEAFFEVTHGPAIGSAKFSVHTNNVRVDVLGTRFNVREGRGGTNVLLSAGKIKLAIRGAKKPLLMKPGDLVELSNDTQRIVLRSVKPQLYTAWKESQINLDNTSLGEIATLIEKNYDQTVLIDNQSLVKRRMTVRLPENNLPLLLETVARTLDLTVSRSNDTIRLKGHMPTPRIP